MGFLGHRQEIGALQWKARRVCWNCNTRAPSCSSCPQTAMSVSAPSAPRYTSPQRGHTGTENSAACGTPGGAQCTPNERAYCGRRGDIFTARCKAGLLFRYGSHTEFRAARVCVMVVNTKPQRCEHTAGSPVQALLQARIQGAEPLNLHPLICLCKIIIP